MKLSKRLKQIEQMVTANYTHIWDCCCDHGFLGASLLSRQAALQLHFVDIVPELITTLEHKLQQFYPKSVANWQTHCMDIAKLPLAQYPGTHLIIIAGVGGELMSQFISDIYRNNSNVQLDFLLCPVNQQFTLREKLIALDCHLIKEVLVEDNSRFYEVMLLSSASEKTRKVSAVGDDIWQSDNAKQAAIVKKYLNKTLAHYHRVQQGRSQSVDKIISAYRNIKL